MARHQKNEELRREMCRRLRLLAEDYLEIDLKNLSDNLGYKNDTVLRKVWKGDVFPDTERLVMLAKLKNNDGSTPNIHWIITGEGCPLLLKADVEASIQARLTSVFSTLPKNKSQSLLLFLEQ